MPQKKEKLLLIESLNHDCEMYPNSRMLQCGSKYPKQSLSAADHRLGLRAWGRVSREKGGQEKSGNKGKRPVYPVKSV